MKKSVKIGFRVNSYMADKIISRFFDEIRKDCKNQSITCSKISRAMWMSLELDKKLRKRFVSAICKFLKYDTIV